MKPRLLALSLAVLAACAAPLPVDTLEPLPAHVSTGSAMPEAETSTEVLPDLQTGSRRTQATAEASNGLFSAYLGGRKMRDGSFWTSLDEQFALGLEWMMKRPRDMLGVAVGTQVAYKRESAFTGTVDVWAIEGYIGPKIYIHLGNSPVDVYASAGPTLLYYDVEAFVAGLGSRRSSDTSFAGYGTLGAMFNLNRRQAIGLEFRTVQFATGSFFGVDGDSNYDQLSFVFSSYL